MKKNLIILALGLAAVMPAKAQWNSWNTSSTISGVFGAINHGIESAERKKAMEIHAKEKVEYEQSFKDAMESAKERRKIEDITLSAVVLQQNNCLLSSSILFSLDLWSLARQELPLSTKQASLRKLN